MKFSITRGVAGFLACLVLGCAPSDDFADRPHDGPEDGIDLASGSIDSRNTERANSDETQAPDGAGQYLIVQLDGPATSEELALLAASVDRIYGYLPHDSFLVRVTPGQPVDSLGAWAGVYRPEHKIARGLREDADRAAQGEDGAEQTIMVQAYPDADVDAIAGALDAIPEVNLVGMGAGRRFSRLRLRVPADRVVSVAEELAARPDVFWIDVEGQRALLNDTTVWVGQSGVGAGQATPVFDSGIHGEGQVVGLIDTGIDPDSCFFRDPARGLPPQNVCDGGTAVDPDQRKVLAVDHLWATECVGGITGTEWDPTAGHGSHAAGSIAGDNFVNPIIHDPADGMAPGAKLIVQDAGLGADLCGSLPGIGCPVVDLQPLFAQAYAQGARLHSNSWGDRPGAIPRNRYTAASEDVDEFMWTHPDFLLFFSAGNSGSNPNTVISPSTAKNAVSVGATLRGNSAESMAVFSGCGPTADGRIKPDVTIPGSSIISARSDGNAATNNCTTVTMSGTSMATPNAAGLGALVRQYYTDGFYPSGAATPADGLAPSAALVKATLLNSAKQMTGSGSGTFPGNCQGWGRILLDAGLYFAGQARRLFATDDAGFAQGAAGEEKTFTFVVEADQSLKVTVAWTDFPSTPAASINLVNDLDLVVTGPAGTFQGNVFSGGLSQPGGSPDRRNTVEQVLLATPAPGAYTVTVRAFNIPVGPQPFALVVTGDAFLNEPPVADAGPDQTGQIGAEVVLDGSASNDPDELPVPLSFAWTQIDGPAVTLTGAATAQPSFTPTELGTYTFRLVVSDGADQADDTVVVTVANQAPIADAGADQSGNAGNLILLDGSASNDPDDVPSPLSFAWTQIDGPPATLAGADTAQASFTPTALGTYTFRLAVSDGAAEAEDAATVTILNLPPVASAGADQTGNVGNLIVLDGSASSDPDGVPSPLSFAWTQIDGPPATLAGADTAQASFTPTALGTYTFRLAVSDGAAEDDDTIAVSILNLPPVADAGPDHFGLIGPVIVLDGGASSDPDGVPSPLSYAWTQTDGPPVTLTGADTVQASFTPTALGTYTFHLSVTDGAAQAEDTVTVTIINQAPIANAGPDQTGLVGVAVALDGSASIDPDGVPAPLSYAWTQTDGPPVTLTGADAVQASFTPTALGTYTFRLVVSDGAAQAEDTVAVTMINQGPTADAGPDQTDLAGVPILLDGTGSTDPDDGPSPLSFAWTQTEGPPVTLAGADTALASFTPTALGTYTFRLVVADGEAEDDDTVTVTIINQAPVADAGPDQTGAGGSPVVLDGSGSSDPDGVPAPLSFAWTQLAGPPATLAGADTAQPSFTPAASGTYTFRLVVSDGEAEDDDTVTVTVPPFAGVLFADDFEQDRGWTANPSGTDTATTGRWERGQPEATSNNGVPMQLGVTVSGTFDLSTGADAGAAVGDNDIDSGTTTIVSPQIALPAGGQITLSLAYYMAHLSNSSSADFLRVRIVGATTQTVVQELGAANDDAAVWQSTSVDISAFAGQTVRIHIEAADASTASLVEAAVDDVTIEATF